jgi:nitrite reductase/ring-hydroxylating ferredoxin subunit
MKTKVADLRSLADGKAHCVKLGRLSVILVQSDGAVHAIENRCPHLGLPLARGKIAAGEIACPFHGSRFKLETGENTDWVAAIGSMKLPSWSRTLLAMGKKPQPLRVFPVSVEGEDVLVELSS